MANNKNIVNTQFICTNCNKPMLDVVRTERETPLFRFGVVLGSVVDIVYNIPVCDCLEPIKPVLDESLPPDE